MQVKIQAVADSTTREEKKVPIPEDGILRIEAPKVGKVKVKHVEP